MTERAVPVLRIGHIMGGRLQGDAVALPPEISRAIVALQTNRENHGAPEQTSIGGTMREMAGLAAIHPDRGMLENERASLVGMTFQAGLFVPERLVHHAWARRHAPRGRRSAVRIMTVRALHNAFVHPVLERHVELRPHRTVAAIAQIRLGLRQEKLRSSRAVNRVAVGTNYIGKRMLGSPDISPVEVFPMTAEAIVENGLRLQFGESDDSRLAAAGLHMGLTRSVASLTTGLFRFFPAARDALVGVGSYRNPATHSGGTFCRPRYRQTPDALHWTVW